MRPSMGRLREALFNICQQVIEGSTFLDLFAGSGAMGLEALSREARFVTFIESHAASVHAIRENLQNYGVESQSQVLKGDVFTWLKRLGSEGKKYDIIFADPPYDQTIQGLSYSHAVLQQVEEWDLLFPGGLLFIEEAMEAAPPAVPFKTLFLQGERNYGRSTLQEWRKEIT